MNVENATLDYVLMLVLKFIILKCTINFVLVLLPKKYLYLKSIIFVYVYSCYGYWMYGVFIRNSQ